MTRALVVTNPAAARTAPGAVQTILTTLRDGGWEAESAATAGHGDARRLAASAVREGFDVVAVFGGDGTTMQAAASLVGSGVCLGVLPGGTGNLLAGNLRIPSAPARAARALLRATPRPIDLGRVERDDGTHYFAVACGAGYDARVMAETRAEHKRRWGMAAYVATTLRLIPGIRSAKYHLTVDGVEREVAASVLLVANCGEVIPPFIKLRSGISPTDGVLDVVTLRADGVGQSLRAVWDLLLEGDMVEGRPGFVGYARGREIRIDTDPVQPVQLDGEAGGVTPFSVSVIPHAIKILAPSRF